MATGHLGTNANTSLVDLVFERTMAAADVATIAEAIKDDQNPAHPIWPGAFAQTGLLYVPNRGILKCLPGDYVAYDATTGWPILVSARAVASGPWHAT